MVFSFHTMQSVDGTKILVVFKVQFSLLSLLYLLEFALFYIYLPLAMLFKLYTVLNF